MLKIMIRPMFVALLCAVTLGASAVRVRHRDRPAEPAPLAGLSAEPGCSSSRAGVATLSVSWRGTRAALAQQRLDVAVHKGGFDKGLFVTLDRIERGAQTSTPSATRLPVSFFRTALALTATAVAVDPAASVRVDLEGVQPGLYYFVRMSTESDRGWTAGPVVRQPISPCIVEESEDGPRRRR